MVLSHQHLLAACVDRIQVQVIALIVQGFFFGEEPPFNAAVYTAHSLGKEELITLARGFYLIPLKHDPGFPFVEHGGRDRRVYLLNAVSALPY